MSGGGGAQGSGNTQQVPGYAQPYVNNMFGGGAQNQGGMGGGFGQQNPYATQYQGGMQNQGMGNQSNLQNTLANAGQTPQNTSNMLGGVYQPSYGQQSPFLGQAGLQSMNQGYGGQFGGGMGGGMGPGMGMSSGPQFMDQVSPSQFMDTTNAMNRMRGMGGRGGMFGGPRGGFGGFGGMGGMGASLAQQMQQRGMDRMGMGGDLGQQGFGNQAPRQAQDFGGGPQQGQGPMAQPAAQDYSSIDPSMAMQGGRQSMGQQPRPEYGYGGGPEGQYMGGGGLGGLRGLLGGGFGSSFGGMFNKGGKVDE
jgi:hypothetical protein